MTNTERRIVEDLEHAMDSVHHAYGVMEEMQGYANLVKKADTIIGKLYNLLWDVIDKAK